MQAQTKTVPGLESWLSVEEAVRLAGCSRVQLYRLMDSGQIDYADVGGHRVVPLAAVRAYRVRRIRNERVKAVNSGGNR